MNEFDNELCWYFYYWLGDKIDPLILKTNKFSRIIKNTIYKQLNDNNPKGFTVCPDSYYLYNLHRFNEYKLLFDYSKDYHNIQLATVNGNATCDIDYKKYIEKYTNIYKKAHSECKKLFDENEHDKLSSFSCKLRDNIGVVSKEQKPHQHQGHAPVQSYSQPSDTPITHQQTSARDAPLDRNQHSDVQNFAVSNENIQMDDTAKGGHSKSITGSVVPVLGVPFISFLLYR
ncbi:CYIR protein, partial [Plasmodium cynomolgi strain B]